MRHSHINECSQQNRRVHICVCVYQGVAFPSRNIPQMNLTSLADLTLPIWRNKTNVRKNIWKCKNEYKCPQRARANDKRIKRFYNCWKRYAVNMFNEGIRCSPFQITCRPPNHLANLPTMKATRNLKCSSQGKAPPSFRLECATPYPELSIEWTNRNLEIYKYLRTRLSSLNSPLFHVSFSTIESPARIHPGTERSETPLFGFSTCLILRQPRLLQPAGETQMFPKLTGNSPEIPPQKRAKISRSLGAYGRKCRTFPRVKRSKGKFRGQSPLSRVEPTNLSFPSAQMEMSA